MKVIESLTRVLLMALLAGLCVNPSQSSAASYTLTRSACTGGTVSGSSGVFETGTQVSVTATADPGCWFDGWRTNSCGGTLVSKAATYTFNMPATNYDLRATFVRPEMVETFETYSTGGASFDSLDKNDSVGPNQAANGLGNPWWGALPPNGRIDATKAHSGSKSLWGTAGGCRDFYNLQFRHGSGSAFAGSVYLDWWFYDPFGSGGSTTNFCGDYTALSYYTAMRTDADYPATMPTAMWAPTQQLAVGMSDDFATGYNPATYQVRIAGDSGGYHNGWFNTSVTRSVGWHRARVVAGPRKTPSNTNDISFFVDDMSNPVMSPRDSITTAGFNIIELNTIMPQAGTCASTSGCVYSKYFHFSSVDDVSFGAIPATPGAAAPLGVGTGSITWKWVDNSVDEDGVHLWDAASWGNIITVAGPNTTSYLEAGLASNSRYYRWVDVFVVRYAGVMATPRVALPPTCTLALPPVYGTSGNRAISCNNGQGSPTVNYPPGTPTTFAAVNGFGLGHERASKYIYLWDTSAGNPGDWSGASQWTSGNLTQTATTAGSYYLHLRACNGDGAANTNALTLGPYVYQGAIAVARISDAWTYDDGVMLSLTGKPVTAAFAAAEPAEASLWIEEADRTAGMRVAYAGTSASWQDHLVTVVGALDSSVRPRTLVATSVQDLGPASPKIAALEMVARGLGGSDFNAKTLSITGGVGRYNAGLLVKVAGNVTFADNTTDPSNRFFYVDDGSSLAVSDGSGHAGVKVKCGTVAAPTSGMVKVTGVVSMELSPNGYVPVLIIRDAGDVVPVP